MLKLLAAPATNDRGPRHMERVFAALHQSRRLRQPLALHIATHQGRPGLFLEYDDEDETLVCQPITAHYPNCTLTSVEGLDDEPDWPAATLMLRLRPDVFPLLRHAQFEDTLNRSFADPITGLLQAVTQGDGTHARIAIRITPASERRCRRAESVIRTLDREFFRHHPRLAKFYARHATHGFWRIAAVVLGMLASQTPNPARTMLDTSAGRQHDREEDLQAAAAKIGGHLFHAEIRLTVQAAPDSRYKVSERFRQMIGAFGAFTEPRLAVFEAMRETRFRHMPRSLFAHDELATLFHAPTTSVATEGMQTAEFRELEPPSFPSAGDDAGVTLGRIRFREDRRLFSLDSSALARHIYCIGATGTGKSTLLLNMISRQMRSRRGLSVIDVHGDLIEAALALVPSERTNDVLVFDAGKDNIIPFNPLACPDPNRADHVTSGVVSAFKKLFDSWGPRLESLLRFSVMVTVEQKGTLMDVLRLLTDKTYRDYAVARTSDEVVRSFWLNEFASWNGQYRTEAVSSVTNKIAPALASKRLRAITASESPDSLNLRTVLDRGQILLVNVSRGLIGQDHSTLLGSLILTSIEQAALSRADMPEHERLPHTLYLDEFQSLITPSTSIMLSESRKYALSLVLSHQLTGQLDPATYHAVLGNCGTLIALRTGLEDAEKLAQAFSKHPGQLTPADMCNLPNHTAYVRALIDGHPSRPFSLNTLPPPLGDPARAEIVRRTSQRRYGRPVEKQVNIAVSSASHSFADETPRTSAAGNPFRSC